MKFKTVAGLLLLILLSVFNAQGFEIDGLGIGLPKALAKALLADHSTISETENHIVALCGTCDRFLELEFCQEKLVKVKKDIDPSMREFILWMDKVISWHGKPVDSHTGIIKGKSGDSVYRVSFFWKSVNESIILEYSVFPGKEQLTITYETENECSCECRLPAP